MALCSRILFWSVCTIMLIFASLSAGCISQQSPAITPTPTAPASTTQVATTPAPTIPAITTMAVTTPAVTTAIVTTTPVTTTPSPGVQGAITIKNFAFDPGTLTIKSGTTVTWTNQDGAQHQIASDSGSSVPFKSSPLSTGASYQFTFTVPGIYTYHCAIHPSMQATIIVQG